MSDVIDERALYSNDAEFRASVNRVAAECGASAAEVLDAIAADRQHRLDGRPDVAAVLRALAADKALSAKPLDNRAAATFTPGLRRPGHRKLPPVPRWARARR